MARIQKRRLYLTLVAILLSSVLAWGFGCGGGGGGGSSTETTPEFQAVQYFPLTSSWETDNWTLFIDERQHDVNGTMTKAMVDTSQPTVFYWTCDDDGLRLHRYIDEDEGPLDFSPPILIAAAVAKVGDTWEGTYTVKTEEGIDLGQIKLTSKIVGIEDISVPAGDFADCFKLEVAELDPTDDSLYWKETWWLAEGVGLVKIVYSPESEDEDGIFAGKGEETRQLLGYHITPSDLTDDEKKIKELRADFSDAWEQENLAAIDNLYADSWSSRCKDKTARMQEFADDFFNHEAIANFASISDIVINGDEAKCMIQRLAVGIGDDGTGSEWASWNRGRSHMIKEGSEWKYYGSQIGFQIGWMFAWTRKYVDGSRFLDLSAAMEDCAGDLADKDSEITSLTVTGPPGTFTDLDLAAEWNPDWLEYWLEEDISKAQNGFYTFRLVDYLGNIFETTDYLVVMPPLDIPNLVSPIDGATTPSVNVTLDWDPVDRIDYYKFDLDVWDTDVWRRILMITTTATQVDQSLAAGTDHRWRVRARQRDMYEKYYDNETRSDWEYFSTP
jgi:hypothetical protein